MNTTFESVIRRRRVPEMPEYLCANIIAAAARHGPQYRVTQSRAQKGLHWLGALGPALAARAQAGFSMPAQAMAVMATLMFGVSVGMMADATYMLPSMTTNDLSSFLEIDDRFVATEFLSEDWSS